MPVAKKSVSFDPKIMEQVIERGAVSAVINRDLERLYSLYRRSIVKLDFSVEELMLIVDCLNGSLMDTVAVSLLWAQIEDGIAIERLDEKWKVDGKVLVDKLKALKVFDCMAIVDAAERFWQKSAEGDDVREVVKQCFLVKTET
jgi:hypothetical protein